MTARYRCPWCGSFRSGKAKDLRSHVVERHARVIEGLLAPIETFTTHEEENPP